MALSTIPTRALTEQGINFRNLIINGDMSIAQRGTSVTGITSGAYNTADRFYLNMGTAGTWTNTISTDVPTGQGFAKSFKLDCTTANASLSAGSYMTLQHKFEGQMLQHIKKGTSNAESLTLSFWVKSNKTGTYIAYLRDGDNSRDISKSYTIDSANTWEKKTITFEGDTTGTLDNDNGLSFYVYFWLVAGSTYQSGSLQTSWGSSANSAVGQVNLADSTSNYINITGVQLEVGTSASDFEFLPYDVNLRRCQRYYFVINQSGANGGPLHAARTNGGADVQNIGVQCPVPLRIGNPTVTIQSGTVMQVWTENNLYQTSAGGGNVTSLVNTGSDSIRLMINTNGFSGMSGNVSANWGPVISGMPVDAEL